MNQSDRTPENRSRQTSSTGEEQKIESGCTVASGLSTFMKAVKKDGAGWADSASGVEVSWFSV
ncbi:MAG: hypothetical protein GWM98_17685, partial [Nitrospinaceae bacterium]|nr:hypothetical protein [Nitrospinaceae bacterium]NIR55981.1 hypothetical protein [Nitrospinaceae bacterium]NIS86424.1 hypothetical protein [Nitrospinaceae bacterium]NIT83262.1 hypothetical protein [Nitrospinaceae bacterium]NIU45469.1 hypothetical protein [Nitrospinaceae bacterium]